MPDRVPDSNQALIVHPHRTPLSSRVGARCTGDRLAGVCHALEAVAIPHANSEPSRLSVGYLPDYCSDTKYVHIPLTPGTPCCDGRTLRRAGPLRSTTVVHFRASYRSAYPISTDHVSATTSRVAAARCSSQSTPLTLISRFLKVSASSVGLKYK
jgi:hypothetical protein